MLRLTYDIYKNTPNDGGLIFKHFEGHFKSEHANLQFLTHNDMQYIGVFLSSHDNVPTSYRQARIFGIVPQFVVDRNVVSDTLDVEIRTAGLTDRKTILIERSDLMIALPGGVGTLDEIFTLLAEITIDGTRKHLVLYNVDGCWDTLVAMLDQMVETNLVHLSVLKKVHVVESTEALEELCQSL